jgi:hypothetical protein
LAIIAYYVQLNSIFDMQVKSMALDAARIVLVSFATCPTFKIMSMETIQSSVSSNHVFDSILQNHQSPGSSFPLSHQVQIAMPLLSSHSKTVTEFSAVTINCSDGEDTTIAAKTRRCKNIASLGAPK